MEQYERGYWNKRFTLYEIVELSSLQIESLRLARSKANNRGIILIDLGCGDGRNLFAYYSDGKLDPQDMTIAIDISEEGIQFTQRAVPKTMPIRGDSLRLPIKKNTCNLVFCSMLIEHVPDDILLREIKDVLAPGGILHLITVVRRPYAPFRTRSPEGHLVLALNHLREYKSNQDIIDLVTNHGFVTHRIKSNVVKVYIVHRLLMLGLKLRLFDLSLEKRMVAIGPKLKKIIKLLALPIPIVGYYTFEGIFIASEK